MKKKPDILVVLAAVLGLGIVVSSIGTSQDVDKKTVAPEHQETQIAVVNQ
ncbi:hypothetical protein [Pleionea litopenaei]|uniref:Uncharacterized protein n=1 Tax=Pleionea litopenaei TaxID=3070815 RepID=A0AA51X5V1_9GAMM|nr:hypothetical protein [Pleionea sp. HL-JVS1]WMS86214.1 hypothetical protein Q9312_13390 [Pleionea sp. HL-JVS1]